MSSDEKGPGRSGSPTKMVLAVAGGLAILAAIVGVQFFQSGSATVENGPQAIADLGEEACALDKATVDRVTAASIGEVRAFVAMDRPYSLASFRFKDAVGTSRTIEDWNGRTVLLNLWATWCAPCRAEMPSLDELQGKLGSETFEVLPISVDKSDPAKPQEFFAEIAVQQMSFFHDEEAMTLNTLKRDGLALGLPATLLVDGRGCAIGRLNGPAEWASPDAQNLIKAAL